MKDCCEEGCDCDAEGIMATGSTFLEFSLSRAADKEDLRREWREREGWLVVRAVEDMCRRYNIGGNENWFDGRRWRFRLREDVVGGEVSEGRTSSRRGEVIGRRVDRRAVGGFFAPFFLATEELMKLT